MPAEFPDLQWFRGNAAYGLVVDSHAPGPYVEWVLLEDNGIVFLPPASSFFLRVGVLEEKAQLLTIGGPLESIQATGSGNHSPEICQCPGFSAVRIDQEDLFLFFRQAVREEGQLFAIGCPAGQGVGTRATG